MPEVDQNEKRYPVKFAAPNPAVAPPHRTDGEPTSDGRPLKTYIHDWMTVQEFEALMPNQDIVRYMCYETVGPDSWTINIAPEEVLSCERDHAVQTLYVNEVLRVYVGRRDQTAADTNQMARGYGEISPDAMLFLMRLHEFLNPPTDNFDPPNTPNGDTLQKAVDLMLENGIKLHDLIKTPEPTEEQR